MNYRLNFLQSSLANPKILLQIAKYSIVFSVSLWIYKYIFPSLNNVVEVPPVFARISPQIYNRDYYVLANLEFSPRFYYQLFLVLLYHLGFSVEAAYLIWYIISFFLFLGGLYAIGKIYFKSRFTQCLLPFLGLVVSSGTIGFVDLFRQEPIPAIYAMGFSIWGLYFGLQHQWIQSYLFFGVAILIQFLVGFLPAGLLGMVMLLEAWETRNWKLTTIPILILIFFVALVYIPMQFNALDSGVKIENLDFVYIYGYLRHPHHIIPSHWHQEKWMEFLLFYISGILLVTKNKSLSNRTKKDFLVIVFTTFLTLGLTYFFVEVFPISLFAKLQLARTTPFSQLIVLIGVCATIQTCIDRKQVAFIPFITVSLVNAEGSTIVADNLLPFLLVASVTVLSIEYLRTPLLNSKFLLTSSSAICIILVFYRDNALLKPAWLLALFAILTLPFWLDRTIRSERLQSLAIAATAIVYGLFLVLGFRQQLGRYWRWFDSRIQINQEYSPLYKLAVQFQEVSSPDVLVLTPPNTPEFRYHSRRSTVWDVKSFPYTDRDILTWKERAITILGTQDLQPGLLNATELYQQRSSDELVEIARQYGATHLLTQQNWHSDVPHVSVLKEGEWVLYELPDSPSQASEDH